MTVLYIHSPSSLDYKLDHGSWPLALTNFFNEASNIVAEPKIAHVNVGILIVIIICTILSAFFSMSETALSSISEAKVKTLVEDRKPGSKKALFCIEHYEKILGDVAEKTSIYERRADDAEREVERMKKVEYMENYIGETFEGIISGMTSWGIYVELKNTIEGMVRIRDMSEDRYEFDQDKYEVRGHFTGKTYTMGQEVVVKCVAADKDTRTIDFILAQDDI